MVRKLSSDYDPSVLVRRLKALAPSAAAYSWDLAAIMSARDAQLSGRFASPVRMSESMRTDDAIYTAIENRLAPAQMLSVELIPSTIRRGKRVAADAERLFGAKGGAIRDTTMSSIRLDYIQHGVGVGVVDWTPKPDGSRIDVRLRHWPLEYVWVDTSTQTLYTRTADDSKVPIVHGDGRWVVFAKQSEMPWRKQAAILPGCMVWARHAFASRDWAKGSASHGNAKVVGALPEGVSLQAKDADGNLTTSPQASEFLALLADIASLDTPVGIRPAGSTVDYITNSSKAWEVWERLIANAERSAARIYLGTDGTLGAQGGAPGVDVAALFGVARTRVEGDLACESDAIASGMIEPWAAVNHGDAALAPTRVHLIPDSDADAAVASYAQRSEAFWRCIESTKASGCVVDDEYLATLAARYMVEMPRLSATDAADTDADTDVEAPDGAV